VALASRGAWRAAALAALGTVAAARGAEVLPGAVPKLRAIAGAPWSEADFACGRVAARRLAEALGGETLAQRHFQQARYFAPDLAVMDLTGINNRAIAHRREPGPVRFGRNAIDTALAERVGALHLPPRIAGRLPLADRPLEQVLAHPDRAALLLGEPVPAGAVAAELLADYRSATLPGICGAGTHLNVLVRSDLAPRFRRAGFTVADPD
jgi:hypothetical protein